MELRDWQKQLKDKVINAVKEGFLVALNSPTGSGKTLFSLLVGLNTKGKVIFVVRTHNEYFPVYRDVKKIDPSLKFSFVIGKPSACPFAAKDVDTEDINCKYCEIKNAIEVKIDKSPFEKLKELKENGIKEGFCPYYSLLESAKEADIITITYPYFFIEKYLSLLDINLEEYFIVIDEAHNIDKVSEIEERTLSEFILSMAIKQSKSEEVRRILDRLIKELKTLTYQDEKYIKLDKVPELSDEELSLLVDEYEELRKEAIKSKSVSRIYLGSVIRFYATYSTGNFIPFSFSNKIVLKTLELNQYYNLLNDENLSILLMSGTLPPKEYLEKVIGISRKILYINVEKEVKKKVTGSYQCKIAIDVTSKYDLRSEAMWKKYSSYLLKIYYQARNHVLAVFPSYQIMEKVMSYVNVNKILENEGTRIDDVIKIVKESRQKYIIAGVGRGKITEGVEITDNDRSLISDVVLVGVPYPPEDDYMKLLSKKISEKLGGKEKEYLIMIPALITVKQAIGRSIRNINDTALVWLLDKRYDSLWWKKNLNCFNSTKIRL
ncbi:helicase C-terminal domain-containing protein [Sulfurisphaera tokodaii]|uniref:DNA repair helicase XPD n=2 Tax=Sulfurisphaera tokodaii TaxID=111955 RepID=Q96Y88_SULTO|nr:ATP-dependent DNA helicase [Sulfurisphaera tokodaii]BAB67389.1 DNA repair helicase XPD [Sulfurisphaera tokodaii str. 7]HII75101.1 ATP-dependent DNA helicase [Sulfurisphaera tokodaii]